MQPQRPCHLPVTSLPLLLTGEASQELLAAVLTHVLRGFWERREEGLCPRLVLETRLLGADGPRRWGKQAL